MHSVQGLSFAPMPFRDFKNKSLFPYLTLGWNSSFTEVMSSLSQFIFFLFSSNNEVLKSSFWKSKCLSFLQFSSSVLRNGNTSDTKLNDSFGAMCIYLFIRTWPNANSNLPIAVSKFWIRSFRARCKKNGHTEWPQSWIQIFEPGISTTCVISEDRFLPHCEMQHNFQNLKQQSASSVSETYKIIPFRIFWVMCF